METISHSPTKQFQWLKNHIVIFFPEMTPLIILILYINYFSRFFFLPNTLRERETERWGERENNNLKEENNLKEGRCILLFV